VGGGGGGGGGGGAGCCKGRSVRSFCEAFVKEDSVVVRVEAQRVPCTWGEKLGAQIICVSPLDFLYN